MSQNKSSDRHRLTILAGLGTALLIAILLSPFASKDPDGLDRVSKDLKFEEKATEKSPAKQLPFYQIFNEYSLKGINNEKVSTALAGAIGTLCTFGIAYGLGKVAVRRKATISTIDEDHTPEP